MKNEKGQFVKGHKENTGDKNPRWKGDKASYFAIHIWINKHYGRARECEICHATDKKRYEWAAVEEGIYPRTREGWMRLCTACHRQYDNHPFFSKIIQNHGNN